MAKAKIETHNFKLKSGEFRASLLTPEGSSGKLAVVLPGAGYTCKQPLLHFATQVLIRKKFNVLTLDTVYADNPEWLKLPTLELALQVVEGDAVCLFEAIRERISDIDTILGRSLGTYSIACGLEQRALSPRQIVWQTPSLNSKWGGIKNCGIPGFAIMGTGDERFPTARAFLPDPSLIIESADHGMEIPGDPIRSIEILKQVTQATSDWIQS